MKINVVAKILNDTFWIYNFMKMTKYVKVENWTIFISSVMLSLWLPGNLTDSTQLAYLTSRDDTWLLSLASILFSLYVFNFKVTIKSFMLALCCN